MNISFGDVLMFGLMLVSLFLMFVILLQRGRGGGLAGAFGGLGGQSAFGTKAGDVFTVITIVTVVIWVVLSCLTAWRLRYESSAAYKYHGEGIVEPQAGGPDDKAKDGEKSADGQTSDQDSPAKSAKKKSGSDKTTPENPDDELKLDDGAPAKADSGKDRTDGGTGAKNKTGVPKDGQRDKPDDDSSSKE